MNLEFLVPILYPVGILACLLSLRWPQTGMYYLVFVLPLQTLRYDIHDYPLGASIIDVVLIGVILGNFLQGRKLLPTDLPMRVLLIIFCLFTYVSLWQGSFTLGYGWPTSPSDPRLSFWKSVVELVVIAFVAYQTIRTERQIRTVLTLMCAVVLMVSYDLFAVMQSQDLSHYSYTLRYASVLGYAGPNGLAVFEMQFALFLIGFFSLKHSRTLLLFVILALIATIYGTAFSFSRGAYVAFAAGLFFIGVARYRLILVLLLVGALGSSIFIPSAIRDRVDAVYTKASSSTEDQLENSAMQRVMIWQNALGMFRDHPITGSGFNTYAYMHPVMDFRDTHNYYLKLLVEGGLVGLLLFLAILGNMFRSGYSLFRKSSDSLFSALGFGFAACIIGSAVANFFGDRWTYQQLNGYLWILLALVWRASALSADSAVAQQPSEVCLQGQVQASAIA